MVIQIRTYADLERYVQGQLQKGQLYDANTFYQSALEAKQAISTTEGHAQKMAAVARYGAVIKRWHHMLIVHITHIALQGAIVSRTNVRHWQKAVFGKSMDSKSLRIYADSSRTYGDKVASLPTEDSTSLVAARVFTAHKNLLKIKTNQL